MDLDNLTGHEKWDLILKNQSAIFNELDTIQVLLKHSDESISIERKSKSTKARPVYKENYDTGKYIKVGIINNDNVITLDTPKGFVINTTHFTPTLYSTSWYVEPRGYEGTDQYLGIFPDDVKNTPQEIIVKGVGLVDKVTGYITEKGKVVYYDQYLGD